MIFIDNRNHNDPRINLALEEFIVRNRPDRDYLLLYVNDPSVILGKHQNALEEVDRMFALGEGIQVVRRISGGGAVYHDRGNLNFCIVTDHSPERHNNYRPFLKPVIDLLATLGVRAELNNRNSLVLADGRKFSGNAQFASRGRMLSHGTLLFDSDLEALTAALSPKVRLMESRAVQSIRSDVVNLRSVLPSGMTQKEFSDRLIREFSGGEPTVEGLSDGDWKEVTELAERKYASWEWNFGRTPRFVLRHTLPNGCSFELTVRDGVIEEVEIETEREPEPWVPAMKSLRGKRYEAAMLKEILDDMTTPNRGVE